MNILFDMITTCRQTGAGEYVRRIFFELVKAARNRDDINIICLYDSARGIAYDDLSLKNLKSHGANVLDIKGKDLTSLIAEYHIDNVFIGCAQFWHQYKGVESIACKTLCVIHDLSHQEKLRNHITEYCKLRKTSIVDLCYSLWRLRCREGKNDTIAPFVVLAKNNPHANIVVVSDYTRTSLQYLTDVPMNKVIVLYSPLRSVPEAKNVESAEIAELIANKEKFFVLLGAHISLKNGQKAIRAFERYVETGGTGKLLTIGRGLKKLFGSQVVADFVSDSDLDAVFRHCHALVYPSLFEGFGYPPLEAMRYGKPVICSNACSMPEILGDAPIYFSPLYETAIFQALQKLENTDYSDISKRSRQRYEAVNLRQEHDLRKLLNLLTV